MTLIELIELVTNTEDDPQHEHAKEVMISYRNVLYSINKTSTSDNIIVLEIK